MRASRRLPLPLLLCAALSYASPLPPAAEQAGLREQLQGLVDSAARGGGALPAANGTAVPKENPLLIAHRGYSMAYPENTMPAFIAAYETGADVLETDVFLSSDGVVTCIHDTTVDRTTEGSGPIGSFTYEELRALDAGYRWTRDGGASYPFRGQGIYAPSLREALERLPLAVFNVDMKEGEPMAAPLAELIEELGVQDRVLVATTRTDGGGIETFRRLQPSVRLVATVGEALAFGGLWLLGLGDTHVPESYEYQLPVIGGLTDAPEFIVAANSIGQNVQHWTINDPDEMLRLLLQGSDGVMTDNVTMGVEIFKRVRPPPSASKTGLD